MLLNSSFLKLYKIPLLLVLISVLFYASFAYDLVRTDYTKLIMLYAGLFFLFYKLIQINKSNFKFLVAVSILLRLVFLVAIPNLSQDFYRFIWDGRMILEGFNPYLYTPESFISIGKFPISQAQELYAGMGTLNGSHFTNYPPINQLCFIIAGLFAGKSILGSAIVMRLLIIAADIGTLYFGKKLLEKLNIPIHNIFWYILNPFIIIELTGNLHFEGVMIFFLVWSMYLLHIGKWKLAAVILALSISVKLIPLIFLPLFYKWFIKRKSVESEILKQVQDDKNVNVITSTTKQSVPHKEIATSQVPRYDRKDSSLWLRMTRLILFFAIVGITILILFLPFYSSEFINNYAETVGLWFQNFEFNASLYYIAREIGYLFRGYNEIAIIGQYIPIVVVVFVLIMTFFRKNKSSIQLITTMLLVLSFYYFISTTVHPWYVATLVILSVFTNYKFPLVWSFIIIISYLAYANSNNAENLWIIGFEYLVVYGVFIWEVFLKKDASTSSA
ncbi:MAG: mannosyltransferase [Flavobacteriaceae bacterium]|nr:mannosyltransferase [Flavobacteriaceae bacterium]